MTTAAKRDGDGATPAERVEMVVITGYSGAGKSEAIAAFEDGGYFCVDNLPPRMIGALGELFLHEGSGVERAAIVSDVRGGEYFEELVEVLGELETGGLDPRSSSSTPTRRRCSTASRRRAGATRWPAAAGCWTGSARSARCSAPLRERADVVMDTTGLTGGDAAPPVVTELIGPKGAGKLALTIITFGFKNGPPRRPTHAGRPLPAEPALPRGPSPPHRAGRAGERVRGGRELAR